ncbi:AIPR family protein [Psychrobacillus sp. FSL H8-0510]|uniref:AIPR family protein n=1 Tax=Psychrobacillus sp. FSL H8-0510 TaxID=2921394 RepID=UPI0030F6B87B
MQERKQKLGFYNEFIDKIESKDLEMGGREVPFMQEIFHFMELADEPNIVQCRKSEQRIKVNAYAFSDDYTELNLYLAEYDIDHDYHVLPEINKTSVEELSKQAKRFFTNAQFILENSDRSLEYYDLAKTILEKKKEIDEVNIFVITNTFYLSNKPIEMKIPGVETVNVHVWDMDRIYRLSEAEQGIRDFDINFTEVYDGTIQMLKVPSGEELNENYVLECYLGYIPAQLLAQLYDEWGPKLVERNVRSFLQARGGTNKGIRDTLKNPTQRGIFVAYNNGISSVAKDGIIEKIGDSNLYEIKNLTSWQIVNGGQTTASIHQAYKNGEDLSEVYVQAKLTIIKVDAEEEQDKYALEDDLVSKISEYANTQNKINKSDLLANTRFMADIEKFSRSTWVPAQDNRKSEEKWYFERARGQYMVDIGRRKKGKEQNDFKKMYPQEKVLTKVELAKYFMSWEGYPHISSKGGEEAFKRFMALNSTYWKYDLDSDGMSLIKSIDQDYYKLLIARCIVNNYVAEIVGKLGLKGYRANVVYYSVAMFNFLYGKQLNLKDVWIKQQGLGEWEEPINIIANRSIKYLRESAGDRNVTQWAKSEECWEGFKKECANVLSDLV